MTFPPSVSVVIPARNDAVALDLCLRQLRRQTVAPLEIIVVDNASRDSTAEVARSHGARVVFEARRGIPMAAAAGYDAAMGEVIGRLDADSVPEQDWIERIGMAFSGSGLHALTGVGRFHELPRTGGIVAALYLGAYYLLCHAALGHHALWGSNMALRRSTWWEVRARVHDADSDVHDDLDLAFALGPRREIRLDRSLTVGVSARSLVGWSQVRRRFRRAWRTLTVNWQGLPPWERWALRLNIRTRKGLSQ